MNPAPNEKLWMFSKAITPAKWISKQAKRIYDAAIEREQSRQYAEYCVVGSVRTTHAVDEPYMSNWGTSPEEAEKQAKEGIAELRSEANRLEKVLNTYGPEAFIAARISHVAPQHPFNAEEIILGILKSRPIYLWVHGVEFRRDESGAYVKV